MLKNRSQFIQPRTLFVIVLSAVLIASAITHTAQLFGASAYQDDCQMAGYSDVVKFAGEYFCVSAEDGVLIGVQIGEGAFTSDTLDLAGRNR